MSVSRNPIPWSEVIAQLREHIASGATGIFFIDTPDRHSVHLILDQGRIKAVTTLKATGMAALEPLQPVRAAHCRMAPQASVAFVVSRQRPLDHDEVLRRMEALGPALPPPRLPGDPSTHPGHSGPPHGAAEERAPDGPSIAQTSDLLLRTVLHVVVEEATEYLGERAQALCEGYFEATPPRTTDDLFALLDRIGRDLPKPAQARLFKTRALRRLSRIL